MGEVGTTKLQKRLNFANMTLGVGILLTIIPLGYVIVSLITTQHISIKEARVAYGWIFPIVVALLPLGLALPVTGLSLLTVAKRHLKTTDVARDNEETPTGKYYNNTSRRDWVFQRGCFADCFSK
jgi:hypothetical protein